jgi:hypothetical protein
MRNVSILAAIAVGCFLGTVVSNVIIHPQAAMAKESGNPSVIKAKQIELVDMNGKKRVSLELEDGDKTAALNMWGTDEKLLFSLKASQDSSNLIINKKGETVVALGFEKENGSCLMMNASKKVPGVWMNACENGGLVMVYGKEGKQKAFVAD